MSFLKTTNRIGPGGHLEARLLNGYDSDSLKYATIKIPSRLKIHHICCEAHAQAATYNKSLRMGGQWWIIYRLTTSVPASALFIESWLGLMNVFSSNNNKRLQSILLSCRRTLTPQLQFFGLKAGTSSLPEEDGILTDSGMYRMIF